MHKENYDIYLDLPMVFIGLLVIFPEVFPFPISKSRPDSNQNHEPSILKVLRDYQLIICFFHYQ